MQHRRPPIADLKVTVLSLHEAAVAVKPENHGRLRLLSHSPH